MESESIRPAVDSAGTPLEVGDIIVYASDGTLHKVRILKLGISKSPIRYFNSEGNYDYTPVTTLTVEKIEDYYRDGCRGVQPYKWQRRTVTLTVPLCLRLSKADGL